MAVPEAAAAVLGTALLLAARATDGAGVAALTIGVATTGTVMVGAAVITDSSLQSAVAIALSVWALIAAEASAMVVDSPVPVLMSATTTLNMVVTETMPVS